MKVQVFEKLNELLPYRAGLVSSPGVVMTMGNLHQGHMSLIEESARQNHITIVTIFVNPKQFGPLEDFDRYPRTLSHDLKMIDELAGQYPTKEFCVFAPQSPTEVYPPHFSTSVSVGQLSRPLCGQSRPGHFDGVATVVCRLLGLTKPGRAYFGQKDYQQTLIIKRMVEDLALPTEIIVCPIVRESSGLALSSRNQYLSAEQKQQALVLYRTLCMIKEQTLQGKPLEETMEKARGQAPFEYLEALDAQTLGPANPMSASLVVAGAIKIGETRLIDNMILPLPQLPKPGPHARK